MFADLVKKVDAFVEKYGSDIRMKSDLLELVQEAIKHGEDRDQNKITGILVKGIKSLFGKDA